MSIQKVQPLIQAVLMYTRYFNGGSIRPETSIPAAKVVEPTMNGRSQSALRCSVQHVSLTLKQRLNLLSCFLFGYHVYSGR